MPFVHVKTQKTHELVVPQTTIPSQYPSEGLKNKKKPVATLSTAGYTDENYMAIARHGITNNKIHVNSVKYFLWKYFGMIKIELDKNWGSYEIMIGKKGETVTPWSLIDIETTTDRVPDLKEAAGQENGHDWMACLFLIATRLSRVTIQTYEDALKERIMGQLNLMGCTLPAIPPKDFYENWILDPSYCKMVAAIDMFLYRFPDSPISNLRICTLSARYRDCAGILSLGYISSLLNLEKESLFLDWLWTEKLAGEIIQMMNPTEEISADDSYFPYQSDMGLVRKTYYSAAKNPQLYFVIHAVGTLLHSQRSKNAKFLSDQNIINNIRNAQFIAYAFANTISLSKAFQNSDNPIPAEEFEMEDDDIEPKTADGTQWFTFARALDFKLTPSMVTFIEHAKRGLGEVRPGTVGEYVRDHF